MGQKVQFTGDDRFSAAQFDAVARHLRAKLPTKTRFLGKKPTEYFSGKRMIEFLMESDYHKTDDDNERVIKSRKDAMDLARLMMASGKFVRAQFVEKQVKKKDGKIKTRKVLQPLHAQRQSFVAEDEPFYWTYDPITNQSVFYGLLLLGGVAACAALPLWPVWLRNAVIAVLLFIIIGRPLAWLVVWLVTFSRWNFYILPNFDEDNMPFSKRFSPIVSLERSETASGGTDDDDDDDDEGDAEGDDDAADGGDGDADGDADAGDTAVDDVPNADE